MKLAEGAIKPLQRNKTLKSFNKVMEKYQWRKSLALILIFQVASQKSEVFFFTGVYKKLSKNFQRTSTWLLSNYDFFLQIFELNKRLDELTLQSWIRPCDPTKDIWHKDNYMQFYDDCVMMTILFLRGSLFRLGYLKD